MDEWDDLRQRGRAVVGAAAVSCCSPARSRPSGGAAAGRRPRRSRDAPSASASRASRAASRTLRPTWLDGRTARARSGGGAALGFDDGRRPGGRACRSRTPGAAIQLPEAPSSASAPSDRAVPADGVDVPGVGPAATAEHGQVRQPPAQRGVAGTEVRDVADVERLGGVQLGVAHGARRWRAARAPARASRRPAISVLSTCVGCAQLTM